MKIIFFGEDSFSAVVLNSIVIEEDFEVTTYCNNFPYYENLLFKRLETYFEEIFNSLSEGKRYSFP